MFVGMDQEVGRWRKPVGSGQEVGKWRQGVGMGQVVAGMVRAGKELVEGTTGWLLGAWCNMAG